MRASGKSHLLLANTRHNIRSPDRTEFVHREVGHVKIEDTVAVTEHECEGLGDIGREWHVVPV
jgi:Xaa-Pro aminopeptidase